MRVIYSKTQVKLAAKFIVEHNQFISIPESELYQKIKEALKKGAKLSAKSKAKTGVRIWSCYGVHITFCKEDNCIDVYVTVDPAVSVYPQKCKTYNIKGL